MAVKLFQVAEADIAALLRPMGIEPATSSLGILLQMNVFSLTYLIV
jgi:hypothetical protein